jgi:hypothetical protein
MVEVPEVPETYNYEYVKMHEDLLKDIKALIEKYETKFSKLK